MKFDKLFNDIPRDECGVFGVWAPGEDVSRLTYFGLYALQHRGQESAGIAASDGSKILVYKDMGLVSQVFKDRDLAALTGHLALGHVRYSTAGSSAWQNAQPTLGPTAFGTLALAHNGNLVNARELAAKWLDAGISGSADAQDAGRAGKSGVSQSAVAGENDASQLNASTGEDDMSQQSVAIGEGGVSQSAMTGNNAVSQSAVAGKNDASQQNASTGEGLFAESGNATAATRPEVGRGARPKAGRGAASGVRPLDSSSDTMLLARLIEKASQHTVAIGGEPPLLGVMREFLPELEGAYSLVFIDESTLYAARDPRGIRPLVLGRLANGWVVASETAALDIVGASFVREIAPGELLAINENGVHSESFAPAKPAGCVFEYVYLARPDTTIAGQSIIAARRAMGAALARENPVEADLVMATPDSGTPAAIGYAEESGISFGQGFVKNAYVGRTFIHPTQAMRQMGIRLKLNPVRSVIEGKRLVVVDDSIVRGNTQRAVVQMLRAAGAAEVHVRISSPPVMWPCYYGIDFATRAELIATGMGVEEICRSIGADTLAFLPFKAMVAASGQPESELCTACFSGRYPTELPELN